MKPVLKIIVCILLIWAAAFASCKKDKLISSFVTTTPNNHMPVANAGADQIITLPIDSATLDGSLSTDPDNNISSYLWTKIDGPSSFNIENTPAVKTIVKNLVQGNYKFELKITDAGGLFSKDTVQVIVNAAPPPSNTKTIKARVVEYSTDLPIAGATLTVCTSPASYNTCAGNYLSLTTDGSGECIFHADLFNYGWVAKEGYYGYIFNPCFVTYFRNDTLLEYNDDYTADSFIVEIVPKTNFTIHVKDSSGTESDTGNFLIADVDFHNFCCSLPGIINTNLHPGIDTTFQLIDYYGNTNYLFLVGHDPDSGGYPQTVLYNLTKYIPKGNNTVVNIIY